MKGIGLVVAGAVALLVGILAFSTPANPRKGPADVDLEEIARKLVTQSAGVKEGDIVVIEGGLRDFELLENLAVHVRKVGGFPLVLVGSERMIRRMFDDVPVQYDSQTPELEMKLVELADAWISVDFVESPGLLAHVPPQRIAARSEAGAPLGQLFLKRGVRQVNLGNSLYPTKTLAERYGMTQEELSRIFWEGVNADYAKLQSSGEAVKSVLSAGKEIRITNPNGTDLHVRIEGRPIFVSDGVVSAEDAAQGGAAAQVWLPAGEVFLAPVPGTAQGKVVVDREFFQDQEVRGLMLTFEGGKVTSMSAESGIERLKAQYDASASGKEMLGVIDLGINPKVSIPRGSRLGAWMPAGMVTVTIGANTWAGGENDVGYGLILYLPGSTVTVDGKAVVEDGVLKL